MGEIVVRGLHAVHAPASRALIATSFGATRYAARMHALLASALAGGDDEHLGCVASEAEPEAERQEPAALLLFGAVAGAPGASRVHALIGHDPAPLDRLIAALLERAAASGDRLVVCELPQDAPFGVAHRALADAGFAEEGRVDDLVCDGVALRLLVWRPGRGGMRAC